MSSARSLLPSVTAVRHVRDHVVWLEFADGLAGEVDLSDGLTGEILAPLRDPAFFARVSIVYGALAWPNGADWSAESLRERLANVTGRSGKQSDDDAARARRAYIVRMPEISRFYGIIIRMLANEHAPPHFHAIYESFEISVTIRDGIVTGSFPRRALQLVLEWAEQHEGELLENWDRLRAGEAPTPIAPLA